jgi:hypothetical protein
MQLPPCLRLEVLVEVFVQRRLVIVLNDAILACVDGNTIEGPASGDACVSLSPLLNEPENNSLSNGEGVTVAPSVNDIEASVTVVIFMLRKIELDVRIDCGLHPLGRNNNTFNTGRHSPSGPFRIGLPFMAVIDPGGAAQCVSFQLLSLLQPPWLRA